MKTIEEIKVVNENYNPIIEGVLRSWDARQGAPVFDARLTDHMAELADIFEANLPYEGLGGGSCRTCRDFVSTYGALVYHKEDGTAVSALWNDMAVEPRYKPLFAIMSKAVLDMYNTPSIHRHEIDRVGKVSLAQDLESLPFTADYWRAGVQERGRFNHLYIDFGTEEGYKAGSERGRLYDNIQFILWFLSDVRRLPRLTRMLDYVKVTDSLADDASLNNALVNMDSVMTCWKEPVVTDTATARERSHKALAFARGNAHLVHDTTKQLRGGSASVFFDKIEDAKEIPESTLLRYLEMTSPTNYKRVTREFNEKALRLAEQQLVLAGLDKTLDRRQVRKDDELPFIWTGLVPEKSKLTILAGLKVKGNDTEVPKEHRTQQMSWETFLSKYAPQIKELFFVPPVHGNYCGLTTCANPEAPNITLWDNPTTLWTYVEGSRATTWDLQSGKLVRVAGIMRSPEHSQGEEWSPFFTPRHLLALVDGYHHGHTCNGLFKSYLDRQKFDYEKLANIIGATAEKQVLEEDKDTRVFYAVDKRNPVVVLFGEFNKVWTRFEIKTWE